MKIAGAEEGSDHRKEGENDQGDHDFDDAIEELGAAAAGLVKVVNQEANEEKGDDDGPSEGIGVEEILLESAGGEGELGHGPDHIGHDGGDDPGPTEEGMEVGIDELKGALFGGKGDVGDGGEHDDPADHGEGLHPEEAVAGDHSEKKGASEGSAA